MGTIVPEPNGLFQPSLGQRPRNTETTQPQLLFAIDIGRSEPNGLAQPSLGQRPRKPRPIDPSAESAIQIVAASHYNAPMPQSLSNVVVHIIFSTKDRSPVLDKGIRERMHGYLATLCRDLDSTCYKVGGVADHVHIVTSLPRTLTQSKLLEDIKKKSSKWIKREGVSDHNTFAWQRGYGVFSVSPSQLDSVVQYVANQEEHHRTISFQDEYRKFLAKHGVDYDEQYVWD